MAEVTLVAEPGRRTGSSESRRLRAAGRVPAVVYGHGVEGIAVSIDGRDLRHALSGDSGTNQLLELRIGQERHLALARVLQRHPVRHTVLHVDFQIVSRDEVIAADVPVNLIGEATEVTKQEGLVEQQLTSLTVKATPSRIPAVIEVDISGLEIGGSIRVSDLALPEGVATDVNPEDIVVIASVSRVAQEVEEVEAAETEAAEAEGAEAAGADEAEASGDDAAEEAGGGAEADAPAEG